VYIPIFIIIYKTILLSAYKFVILKSLDADYISMPQLILLNSSAYNV